MLGSTIKQIEACSGVFVDGFLQTLERKRGQGHRRFDAEQRRVQLELLPRNFFLGSGVCFQ